MPRRRPRLRRRTRVAAALLALVAVALGATALAGALGRPARSGRSRQDQPPAAALATVQRRDLSSQMQLSATLGYAGSYTVACPPPGAGASAGSGAFTWLPTPGQVVSQGQELYAVDGLPVVLLYGATPAYRSLSEGMSGEDVAQLNADLVALGYASSTELSPSSDYFSGETEYALARLQAALGLQETGSLPLGEAAFLPSAARITSLVATLGAAAGPGTAVLDASSTARQVSIALDAADQAEVKAGDQVSITLPDGDTTPGVISSVGTVATSPSDSGDQGGGGTPTITVLVTPTDPSATGSWDQAPVDVTITTAEVKDALVVPVDALLARAGGGYEVEVVSPSGAHRLIEVSLGMFDDAEGLVQVSSSHLAVGDRVVVPSL